MVSRIATGNSNHEPSKRDAALQLIKFAAGAVAVLSGAAFLSTLTTFKGKNYLTPGLIEKQIRLMDAHNQYHATRDRMNNLAVGMFGAADSNEIEQKTAAQWKIALDNSISALPGKLAHKH